jgi:hypothetical protein
MPRIDAVLSDVRPLFTRSRAFAFTRSRARRMRSIWGLDEAEHRIDVLVQAVLIHAPQAGRAIVLCGGGQMD